MTKISTAYHQSETKGRTPSHIHINNVALSISPLFKSWHKVLIKGGYKGFFFLHSKEEIERNKGLDF